MINYKKNTYLLENMHLLLSTKSKHNIWDLEIRLVWWLYKSLKHAKIKKIIKKLEIKTLKIII